MNNRQITLSYPGILSFICVCNFSSNLLLLTQTKAVDLSFFQQPIRKEMLILAEYRPPRGLGAPPTAGGGTRGGKCQQEQNNPGIPLTPLVPDKSLANGWGLTTESNPKFFVYLPTTSATTAEFVLKDEQENDLYRTKLTIKNQRGISSINLPKNSVQLEVGKSYHWYFSIICSSKNRRQDTSVNGWIRRVSLPENLASQIKTASERDRSKLYAQNGIWHEALATLAEARRKNPTNPELASEWKKLLESAKVEEISDVPFTLTQLEGSP